MICCHQYFLWGCIFNLFWVPKIICCDVILTPELWHILFLRTNICVNSIILSMAGPATFIVEPHGQIRNRKWYLLISSENMWSDNVHGHGIYLICSTEEDRHSTHDYCEFTWAYEKWKKEYLFMSQENMLKWQFLWLGKVAHLFDEHSKHSTQNIQYNCCWLIGLYMKPMNNAEQSWDKQRVVEGAHCLKFLVEAFEHSFIVSLDLSLVFCVRISTVFSDHFLSFIPLVYM